MKKILIVEDNELNLDLLVQLLEDDYDLVSADDGKKGVAMAGAELPDLILMDMSLPVMSGYEAAQAIKSNPALAYIPIIALTAHAMSGDVEKTLAAGCDGYLAKPLDDDLLFETLERFLDD
jgi:CheY-like chemotaxis protein